MKVFVRAALLDPKCEAVDLAKIDGVPMLNGILGVCTSGFDKGKAPPRVIMILIPSNGLRTPLKGTCFFTDGESEDLRFGFYMFSFLVSWRQWMVFEKPARRAALGLLLDVGPVMQE